MHLPASGLLRPFSTITLLPACAPGPAADRCLFYSSIRETIKRFISLLVSLLVLTALVLMDVFLALITIVFLVIAMLNFYHMEAVR